jgi:hypothetical protein
VDVALDIDIGLSAVEQDLDQRLNRAREAVDLGIEWNRSLEGESRKRERGE